MTSTLINAFNATDYVVGGVAIRVGRRSLALDRLLAARGARSCAFITAFNPWSTTTPVGINNARDRRLRRDLHRARIRFARATGNGEAGVVVFGVTLAQASAVGRRYRQDAIVFARRGQPAALITLRMLL